MNTLFSIKGNKYNFLEIFFPWFIILSSYQIFSISISTWILLVYSTIIIFIKKKIIYVNKYLLIFFIYALLDQLILLFFRNNNIYAINNILFMCLSVYIIFACSNIINENNLFTTYRFVGMISIFGLLYHSYLVYVLNTPVTPINLIPYLSSNTVQWNHLIMRPMSFFIEPQAYASFMIPLLGMCIKRKAYLFGLFISFTVLLSTSSLGIVLVILVWLIGLAKYIKNLGSKVFLISIIIVLILLSFNQPEFNYTFDKLLTIKLNDDIRISRRFMIYYYMPLGDKIIGIGDGNLTNYLINSDLHLYWMDREEQSSWGYVTSISGCLIQYGLIAGILYFINLWKMLFNKKSANFLNAAVIIVASFAQSLLFNNWFIFFFIFYFNTCDKRHNEDYIKLTGSENGLNKEIEGNV